MLIVDKTKYWIRYNSRFKKYLVEISELDKKSLAEGQDFLFIELFKNALKSKFYQSHYSNHRVNIKDIKTLDDIKKLPPIDKQLIKNKVDQLWVGGFIKEKGYTSGSSGSPLKVYRSLDSLIKEQAYVWHYRMSKGLKLKDPLLSLRGNLKKGELSRYDKAHNVLYLSSYDINTNTIKRYAQKIMEFKPLAIEAYPSSVYSLAILLNDFGFSIDIPIIFTSSEPLYSYQKELIQKVFHCNIYDWYGNAERTIALQLENDGRYYEPPLYSINEYKEDHILTTSLINSSFPLIRYKVDDVLSDVKSNNDVVSVGSISGRQDDVVLLKDGTRIGRLDHIFKNVNNVKNAQIIQDLDYSVVISVDEDEEYTKRDEMLIYNNVIKYIGSSCDVRFKYCKASSFEKLKSGKFQFVINKIINGNS